MHLWTHTENGNVATRGPSQAGENAQQSCLPCSVVPEDDVELARTDAVVTPRKAAKRPNCLMTLVTVMIGVASVTVVG